MVGRLRWDHSTPGKPDDKPSVCSFVYLFHCRNSSLESPHLQKKQEINRIAHPFIHYGIFFMFRVVSGGGLMLGVGRERDGGVVVCVCVCGCVGGGGRGGGG